MDLDRLDPHVRRKLEQLAASEGVSVDELEPPIWDTHYPPLLSLIVL
jgi:hypothetical protein